MKKLFLVKVKSLINNDKEIYVTEKGKFTKKRKISFDDFIYYILGNNGKTTVLELYDYNKIKYRDIKKHKNMTVTKQGFSKQRIFISPEFFKEASKQGIEDVYSGKSTL